MSTPEGHPLCISSDVARHTTAIDDRTLSMGAELSPNVGFQFSLVWRDEDCIGDQPLS
jgi:hypothetical protein